MVPPMKLRQMVFTCEPVTAAELHGWGTVYKLCEPDDLLATATEVARNVTRKQPRVVRAAKSALNDIDIYDMAKHYRIEQGFTYEMNLYGDGTDARDAFVRGERIITR
jgi:enoyl-CoA hydratase